MQHAKPGSSRINMILSYYIIKQECVFSFHLILFMFSGHTNSKLCLSVNAIVPDLCKITEPRKKQFKMKILHNLKEL